MKSRRHAIVLVVLLVSSVLAGGAGPALAHATTVPQPQGLYPWWNGGFDISRLSDDPGMVLTGRGVDRWGTLEKQIAWQMKSLTGVVGFKIYERQPGERDFRVTHVVDLGPYLDTLGSGRVAVDWDVVDPYTGTSVILHPLPRGGLAVHFYEFRAIAAWAPGTYKQYVVAVDGQGRQSKPSATVSATYLGLGEIRQPLHGAVTDVRPALEWADPAPTQNVRSNLSRSSVVVLWGGTWGPVPSWDGWFHHGETSGQGDLSNYARSGDEFHAAHLTWRWDAATGKADYCPCVSISLPVSFTIR